VTSWVFAFLDKQNALITGPNLSGDQTGILTAIFVSAAVLTLTAVVMLIQLFRARRRGQGSL
jgi:hypothetical protein